MIDKSERSTRPELLMISNGEFTAHISTDGAWLQSFTRSGQDILYPKRELLAPDGSQKLRGGCHVCLPNFGPGGNSGQPQHGFARNHEWAVVSADQDSVRFELAQASGEYTGLRAELGYALVDNSLRIELSVRNESHLPLRVSPGFHPYFATGKEQSVQIDSKLTPLENLAEAQMLASPPSLLTIGESTVQLSAQNLPTWILWSDKLGDYVCLEPTYAGFSFEHPAEAPEMLAPAEERTHSLEITTN